MVPYRRGEIPRKLFAVNGQRRPGWHATGISRLQDQGAEMAEFRFEQPMP
jgi:hypothetical protein